MPSRAEATQQEKYVVFKTAHLTINKCIVDKNYLAAYVISFSLIEDRVRAMYAVWHRQIAGKAISPEEVGKQNFAAMVRKLWTERQLAKPDADLLLAEAKMRNKLVHEAMWNMGVFDRIAVERIKALTSKIDRERKKQKLLLSKS